MPESNERSAEWLRGAVESLNRAQRDFTVTVPELQAEYVSLLAAAEAREAREPSALPAVTMGGTSMAGNTTDWPSAAEVIEAAGKALSGALALDPHCDHTYTHRGGAIWTICDDCGREWADDEGGYKPDQPNKHVVKIEAALSLIARWKEARGV